MRVCQEKDRELSANTLNMVVSLKAIKVLKSSRARCRIWRAKAWPTLGNSKQQTTQRPAPVVKLLCGWLLPHSRRPKRKQLQTKWSPTSTSPQITTTAAAAADFGPLPEPQQPAQEAVASEDAKAAKEEDAGEATQQEDQHEKKEDKDEEKDFNHEEKEDTHEEKTDSNHQESQDGSASASGSQDQEPIARQKSSSEPGLNCSGESW